MTKTIITMADGRKFIFEGFDVASSMRECNEKDTVFLKIKDADDGQTCHLNVRFIAYMEEVE